MNSANAYATLSPLRFEKVSSWFDYSFIVNSLQWRRSNHEFVFPCFSQSGSFSEALNSQLDISFLSWTTYSSIDLRLTSSLPIAVESNICSIVRNKTSTCLFVWKGKTKLVDCWIQHSSITYFYRIFFWLVEIMFDELST